MYESYYGFEEKPFLLSPDPKFFFASPHHQRALSYLQYGLDQGEGFIVITGPIGTGKTTIARNLLNSISEQDIVAVQLVTTKLNPQELLELVAAELKLTVASNSKADLLQAIELFLIELNRQGKRALLVVDEAQNLPAETVEELRMLSNFQLDNKPLIQSFLLGQEELKDIIQAPNMEQFRQRIIASCHLQPLTEQEVKEYILHRLAQVGRHENDLFSDEAITVIHEKTRGVPRKINIFVDRVLLFGFLEELSCIDDKAVLTVASEMDTELTGSLRQHVMTSNELSNDAVDNQQSNFKNTANNEQAQSIKNMLREVEEILESSIKQKVKMTRYIDKLLKQKQQELAENFATESLEDSDDSEAKE